MATAPNKKRVSFNQVVKSGLEDAPLKQEDENLRAQRSEFWDDNHSMKEIRSKDRVSWAVQPRLENEENVSPLDKMISESRREGRTACVRTLLEVMQRSATTDHTDEHIAELQRGSSLERLKGPAIRLIRRKSEQETNDLDDERLETIPETESDSESFVQEVHVESSRWSVWTEDRVPETGVPERLKGFGRMLKKR